MAYGSSYYTVKTAIIEALQGRPGLAEVSVLYQVPERPQDLAGPSGIADVIFLHDAEGSYENVVACGLPLKLDESYNLVLVIECIRTDTDGTQSIVDQRVDELLGEVLGELANNPTFGVTEFDFCRITRGSFRRTAGQLGSGHGARCEFDLEINARLSFD